MPFRTLTFETIDATTQFVGIAAGGPVAVEGFPLARRHLEMLSRHRIIPPCVESTSTRLEFLESSWQAIDVALESKVLHLLCLGTKTTQAKDIRYAESVVDTLRKETGE